MLLAGEYIFDFAIVIIGVHWNFPLFRISEN